LPDGLRLEWQVHPEVSGSIIGGILMALAVAGKEVLIEQAGPDCNVTICGEPRVIKGCNALKLAATMFNRPGADKYTPEEMYDFGFDLKGVQHG
jgi:hypothetical protein